MDAPRTLLASIPLFLLLIAVEAFFYKRRGRAYQWGETLASLGVFVGHHLTKLVSGGIFLALAAKVYEHRLFDFQLGTLPSVLLLFLGVEFTYYWYHRAS